MYIISSLKKRSYIYLTITIITLQAWATPRTDRPKETPVVSKVLSGLVDQSKKMYHRV
jgi:hypothetical protein